MINTSAELTSLSWVGFLSEWRITIRQYNKSILVKFSFLNHSFKLEINARDTREKTLQWGKERTDFQQDWFGFMIKLPWKLKRTR